MFRPNCRAIFRLIFEQVECTRHLFKDIKLCMTLLYVYYILACELVI